MGTEMEQMMLAETDWTFGTVLWTVAVIFFWTMAIWLFIALFSDIFRRRDLSGWAKAGWTILLFVFPFIGALIYVVARPRMTEQDREEAQRMHEAQRRLEGYSAADEVAKLAKLRDSGEITTEEYERLKQRALIEL